MTPTQTAILGIVVALVFLGIALGMSGCAQQNAPYWGGISNEMKKDLP